MSFAIAASLNLPTRLAAADERFWGLGEVGLGVVLFISIFLIVVVGWLLHNTGRRD